MGSQACSQDALKTTVVLQFFHISTRNDFSSKSIVFLKKKEKNSGYFTPETDRTKDRAAIVPKEINMIEFFVVSLNIFSHIDFFFWTFRVKYLKSYFILGKSTRNMHC